VNFPSITIYDIGALSVSMILVVTLAVLVILGKGIDPIFGTAFGTAMGWVFRAGAATQTNGKLTVAENSALATFREIQKTPPTVTIGPSNGAPGAQ
jgi:hypothetical protein